MLTKLINLFIIILMKILNLNLNNYRNYINAYVTFDDGLNFVVGDNAQGKTNLLESIYLSSIGKSPKNVKDKQIINFNAEKSKVNIIFETIGGKKSIEIYLNKQSKKAIKINNLNVLKLTELVGTLSVVYFSPDELKLIKEVPEDRRKFLDISISQFDKNYLYELVKYEKILKQRNAILKMNNSYETKIEQLKLFTPQLIDCAEKIINKRLTFLEKIEKIAQKIHFSLTNGENLSVKYSYKLKEALSIKADLMSQFENNYDKEMELGYTLIGPHRDDIIFKVNDLDSKYYLSQGQQRTIALVMKLSLMEYIYDEIGEYPILLLDDVFSELDDYRQNKLISICSKYQTIISCTSIPNLTHNYNVINVKNGTITQ